MTTAESVLLHLSRSVVSDPDGVSIDSSESDGVLALDVSVGDGDMGRIIGRRGRIATAIRTVVSAAAAKDDITAKVEFVE